MAKPTKVQVHLLANATERPDKTWHAGPATVAAYGYISFRTAEACREHGWGTIPSRYNDRLWSFRVNDAGAKLAKGEVARRLVARQLEQERLRAEDVARTAEDARERAAETARRTTEPHRRGFSGPSSTPALEPATDLQTDALRNDVAEVFLAVLEGRLEHRPEPTLTAAYAVLLGLFNDAVHVRLPANLERHDFVEGAVLLRAVPMIDTGEDAVAFEARAKEIADAMFTLAFATNDQHSASSACHALNRFKTTCRLFGEQNLWNLYVIAKTLGEVARDTAQGEPARRTLLRLMLQGC